MLDPQLVIYLPFGKLFLVSGFNLPRSPHTGVWALEITFPRSLATCLLFFVSCVCFYAPSSRFERPWPPSSNVGLDPPGAIPFQLTATGWLLSDWWSTSFSRGPPFLRLIDACKVIPFSAVIKLLSGHHGAIKNISSCHRRGLAGVGHLFEKIRTRRRFSTLVDLDNLVDVVCSNLPSLVE